MAHFEPTRPAPFGAITIYSAISRVSHLNESVKAWKLSRRTSRELNRLTSAQLEDIGLTRAGIEYIAARQAFRR